MGRTRDDDPKPGVPSIATWSKDRISQDWSYPLAAGVIERGLIGAPQMGLLTLSFRGPNQLALKGIGDTLRIVEVRYLCREAGVCTPRDSDLVGKPECGSSWKRCRDRCDTRSPHSSKRAAFRPSELH